MGNFMDCHKYNPRYFYFSKTLAMMVLDDNVIAKDDVSEEGFPFMPLIHRQKSNSEKEVLNIDAKYACIYRLMILQSYPRISFYSECKLSYFLMNTAFQLYATVQCSVYTMTVS